MIILPKCFLRLIESASTDDLRMAMTGVQYKENEDGTIEATATDGHLLVNIKGESNDVNNSERIKESWTAILPKVLFKNFRKLGRNHVAITKVNDNIVFKTTLDAPKEKVYELPNVRVKAKPMDEKYPNWHDVIPKGDPFFSIAVNSRYLSKIAELVTALQENKISNEIILSFYTENSAIVLHTPKGHSNTFAVKALLMPLRSEDVSDEAHRNKELIAYKERRDTK